MSGSATADSAAATATSICVPGPDHHLAELAKVVFQSGMGRQVVEAKWDGFLEAFEGFDPVRVAGLTPEDVDRLVDDPRIIRNRRKVEATIRNAARLLELDAENTPTGHGDGRETGDARETCDGRPSVGSGEGVRSWLRSFPSSVERDRAIVAEFAFVGPAGVHQFLYGVGEDVSIDCEVTS